MKHLYCALFTLAFINGYSQIASPGQTEKSPVFTNFRMWGGISGHQSELDGTWQVEANGITESHPANQLLAGGLGMHLGAQVELFDVLHADLMWQGDKIDALTFQATTDQRLYQRTLRFRVGVDLLQNDMFSWYFFMGIHNSALNMNTLRADSTGTAITESLVFRSKAPNFNIGTGAMLFFKDESAGILFEVGYQDATLEPHSYIRIGDGASYYAPTGELFLRGFEGRIGLAVRLNQRR